MTEHDTSGAADDLTATPTEDPKERFRQALERKNASGHRTADGVRAGGAVHGPEVTGGGKRTFRRKTG